MFTPPETDDLISPAPAWTPPSDDLVVAQAQSWQPPQEDEVIAPASGILLTPESDTVARLNRDARLTEGGRQMSGLLPTPITLPESDRQAIRQREIERASGVEPIPLGTRIASGLHTGISQGMATPARLVHGAADLAMGAVGAGNTRLARWNTDMLRQYADYENRMQQQDVQTFGPGDVANQLASGAGRAVFELPMNLAPGMGAKTAAQAVGRSAAAAGVIGGGTQYAADRGEGRDRIDAATYATASGLITALTTRAFGATGAESVFQKEGIQGIKNRLLAVFKGAAFEAPEEMVDQTGQDILERYSRNPDKPIDATIKEVLMAGAIGGLVGGGVTGVHQGISGVSDTINEAQQNRAFDRASMDAANETALQATYPERGQNQAAMDAAVEEFNLRPKTFTFEEAQASTPSEPQPDVTPANTGNSQPSAAVATPAPAAASASTGSQAVVEKLDNLSKLAAELQALLNANQIPGDKNPAQATPPSGETKPSSEVPAEGAGVSEQADAGIQFLLGGIGPIQRAGMTRQAAAANTEAVNRSMPERGHKLAATEAATAEFNKASQAAPQKPAEAFGFGAARFGEVTRPEKPFTTKNTVEQINKERKERGLAPLEEHEVFSNKQAVEEAKRILDEDSEAPDKIIARLTEKPETTLDPTERAIMAIHRAKLLNDNYRALKNWRDHFEGGDLERAAIEAENVERYSKQLSELEGLISEGGSGTAAGRSLQAIKIGIAEDYSLDMMTLKAMKAKGDKLTLKEQSDILKQHDELQAKIKKLEEDLARARAATATKDVQDAVTETVQRVRRQSAKDKSAGKQRDLPGEQNTIIEHLKERFIETGDLAGEEMSVRKLMELLVEREGITERLPMETRVHEILQKQVDPTITREQAMDLMSGYGKSSRPNQAPAKVIVRDIAGQILEVRKLLDYFKGEHPKATGMLRDAPSDIKRMWTKMVNEAKKAFKLDAPTDNARNLKSALDAVNTRLTNRLKDLKQEIATREKITRERTPSPYNAETIRLRKEIAELQAVRDEIFGRKEITDEERLKLLEKSTERQIQELERQIKAGEIFPKSRMPFSGESPHLVAARARLAELKEQRQFAREAAQPRPEIEASEIESRVKELDKQIETLEKQIADEAVFTKAKTVKETATDVRVLARESRLSVLKEQRQFIRERLQPVPDRAATELVKRGELLSKRIEEVQRQLRDGDIFPKGKTGTEAEKNDLILAREAELKALKEQRQWAREAAQPKLEAYEAYALNYLLRLRQRAAELQERTARGEFEKPPKPERPTSPEILSAMADVEAAKRKFQAGLREYELAKRNRLQKVWDGIKTTRNAVVNLVSSFDLSAPRQALGAILSNVGRLPTSPIEGIKMLARPVARMVQVLFSDQQAKIAEQRIKDRVNARSGADKIAGIEYSQLDADTFTKHEEAAHSIFDAWSQLPLRTGNTAKTVAALAPKILARGVRASNRAFVTFLNESRAGLFDELLRVNFRDRPPTTEELQIIGNLVNIATGRGKIDPKTASVASTVLWSPKLLASRVQAAVGQPLLIGLPSGRLGLNPRARGIVLKEYARAIMGGYLLYVVSQMFSDKEEKDRKSSDFGKIVRGNVRIDPWGGFQQISTLQARAFAGETTGVDGKTRKTNLGQLLLNFSRSKLRPDIGAAWDVVDIATDRVQPGHSETLLDVAESVTVPLSAREIIGVMKENGFSEGLAIQALGTFGAGVNKYDEKPSR